ncbi:hypothetical protein SDC9_99867 [bioreactor metagenome]|uniref:Uncharacterized protein n=1 Tax=bioreactor metagenome TaxID=1076179 RepID=A0A645AQH3_9ZZZZ
MAEFFRENFTFVFGVDFRHERFVAVLFVDHFRKRDQRTQRDPISILDDFQVVVTGRDADDVGHTGCRPARGTHPEDIMITPLDIQLVAIHESVDNFIRERASVVDVPDNMQVVDDQALDDMRDGSDQFCRAVQRDDGLDDLFVVILFVRHDCVFEKQLLDDMGVVGRDRLSDFRARVFRNGERAKFRDAQQGQGIKLIDFLFGFQAVHDHVDFVFRVVDNRRKLVHLAGAQSSLKNLPDLFFDVSGSVPEYMLQGIVFPMQVADEVLGCFRQVHDGFQVDDFGYCFCCCRIFFCQQSEILVFRYHYNYTPTFFISLRTEPRKTNIAYRIIFIFGDKMITSIIA